MAKTRGKGEGSVYKRADGYWCGSVEAGRYPAGGRRRARVVRRYKADVLTELARLKAQVDQGTVPDQTTTTAKYLAWWLTDVVGDSVGRTTLSKYRNSVERTNPIIGHVKLHRLSAAHVQALSSRLVETYSPGTARVTMSTIRRSLSWATAAGMIHRNPAEGIRIRAPKVKVDDTLTADQASMVLAEAEGDELEAAIWLALNYGLRIGEILALRWPDIDFKAGNLKVTKSKTPSGVRDLPLTDEATAVLKAHQRRRSTVRSLDGWVFARPDGRPVSQKDLRATWNRLLTSARVGHLCRACGTDQDCLKAVRRFHSSRHTAATLLLENGVPVEVVSAILGHSAIGITADLYAKVRSDLKRKGLARIAGEH